MLYNEKFYHRHNFRLHDSICSACLMIVASARVESESADLESAHVCDPIDLYWANQGRLSVLVSVQEGVAHSPLKSETRQALIVSASGVLKRSTGSSAGDSVR